MLVKANVAEYTSAAEIAAAYDAAHDRLWGPRPKPTGFARKPIAVPPPPIPEPEPEPTLALDPAPEPPTPPPSSPPQPPTPQAGELSGLHVCRLIAARSGLTCAELRGGSRRQHIVRPRHIVMYLCVRVLGYSYPKTGAFLGGRDHTTVLHAIKKIEAYRAVDPIFAAEIAVLMELFGGGR